MEKFKKSEESEQIALFEFASYQREPEWKLIFSIPNGGFRSKRTGARLKRQGMKAGIPDVYLPCARGGTITACSLSLRVRRELYRRIRRSGTFSTSLKNLTDSFI